MDEVAQLAAILEAVLVRLEQARRLAGRQLRMQLGDHAHHVALVGFVRAVDVEEFQPGPLRRHEVAAGDGAGDAAVDQMFGPAIGVQRPQPRQSVAGAVIVETGGAVAIGRGGGGVDQPAAAPGTPAPQIQRQRDVVGDDLVDVPLGGGGDGAEMEDGVDFGGVLVEEGQRLLGRHQGRDLALGEVLPLLAFAEAVDDRHVGDAARSQSRDKVGPDEAGPAGDHDHSAVPAVRGGLPRPDVPAVIGSGGDGRKLKGLMPRSMEGGNVAEQHLEIFSREIFVRVAPIWLISRRRCEHGR